MNNKKRLFNYLLEEIKRQRIPISKEIFDQLWQFIDSDEGKILLIKFSNTKLPNYCARTLMDDAMPIKRFF
jgi:hypothetical protein